MIFEKVYDSVYNKCMNKYDEIIDKQLNEKYYDPRELRYGSKAATFLPANEVEDLYKRKIELLDEGNDERFVKPNLLSWNDKPLFFLLPSELIEKQRTLFEIAGSLDFDEPSMDFIKHSRIYSEIEGSLSIENVPTTHKRLSEIVEGKMEPQDLNDTIIKNMSKAIDFVMGRPEFSEKNLATLYSILSDGCLNDDDKLKEGDLYRDDDVMVDHYYGCPVSKIKECMNSLFAFVNENLDNPKLKYFLPHIAHYYVLYVHPYFDYNGRTARMVSLWVSLLANNNLPVIISEAINQRKKEYYSALENTRDSGNDLTYFLNYIHEISVDYSLAYKNIEDITQALKDKGIVWTETEKSYFKKILISYKGKFTYLDFTKFAKLDISKQGALKILNKFASYELLTSTESKSKTKLFDINCKCLSFVTKNLMK